MWEAYLCVDVCIDKKEGEREAHNVMGAKLLVTIFTNQGMIHIYIHKVVEFFRHSIISIYRPPNLVSC